jgi:hypothetical protein
MTEIYPELSHENHFKFGYNHRAFCFRENANDQWWVHYGRCQRDPLNFRDECLATARLIASKSPKPPVIFFSGGIDSEVVLQSFVEAKLPFRLVTIRFNNGLNNHELEYVKGTCEKLKVATEFIDLDVPNFWRQRLLEFADPVRSVSPQLLVMMWAMDQFENYPILGSGECVLRKEESSQIWSLHEKEKIAAWYRHLLLRKKNGCPGFFQFTPELILSYLQDKMIVDLIENDKNLLISNYSIKLQFYQQHFELIPREKYTGFEKLMAEDSHYRNLLENRYPDSNSVYQTKISDLGSQLLPSLKS